MTQPSAPRKFGDPEAPLFQSATLIAPPGATACSWRGYQFDVVDGLVTVPGEAVQDLLPHGFREPAPPPAA